MEFSSQIISAPQRTYQKSRKHRSPESSARRNPVAKHIGIPTTSLAGKMPKYAYLFKDESQRRQYLFVDGLASGQSNNTQLVRDVQTGELVVRKVLKRPFTGPLPPPTLDKEVEIIQLLQSFTARSRLSSPRFAHLISSQDVPISGDNDGGLFRDRGIKYTRVSYWTLYNGGTVADIIHPAVEWMGKSREKPIPYALVARFIKQTCETLQLMYYGSKDQIIFHRDLHSGNIFIHWEAALDGSGQDGLALPDFYIGDFGNSEAVSLSPGYLAHPWDIDIVSLLNVIFGLARRAGLDVSRNVKLAAKDNNERGALIQDLVCWMVDLNEEYMRRRTWPTPGDMFGDLDHSARRDKTGRTRTSDFIADVLHFTAQAIIRPLDLTEVIHQATKLERLFTTPGKLDERGTETYRDFCQRGRDTAKALVAKEPYIFEITTDQSQLGSWRMVKDGAHGADFDIPSPWYVARLLDGDEFEHDCGGGRGESDIFPCRIVGDERGYKGGASSMMGKGESAKRVGRKRNRLTGIEEDS